MSKLCRALMAAAVRRAGDAGGEAAAAHERARLELDLVGSAHKKMKTAAPAAAAAAREAEGGVCATCAFPSAPAEPALRLAVMALHADDLFAPRCLVAFVAAPPGGAAGREGGGGVGGGGADAVVADWAADLMRADGALDRRVVLLTAGAQRS